jgi:phosphatidylinositol kinase/protein kinase (PI-3  family)
MQKQSEAVNLASLIRQYEDSLSTEDARASRYISPAVATAIDEFKKGNVNEKELEELVANDRRFRQNIQENSYLDTQFFVSMAFGESWAQKKARVKAASPDGQTEGWDLLSMIVKSNDDLRQEVCMVQLIEVSCLGNRSSRKILPPDHDAG